MPESPSSSSKSPRGRRPAASRSAGAAKTPATPPPKAPEPAPAAKPRTRRGRRGGARRSKGASETTARAAAPAAPVRAEPEPLDGSHPDALPQISDRQLAALTGLQGSLSAIETRLAGMDRLSSLPERSRVGIFVDVPNVMYAAERQHEKLDYAKMLKFLVRDRELVRASAYAPISDDAQLKLETQKFVQPFVDLGYRIVTKPWKRFADGSIKANFDVELAIDVLTMSDRLDIVTLVSGDGDFRRLVELVESKGVRVEVVAFGQSTAAELRAVADEYIDLSDHLTTLRL